MTRQRLADRLFSSCPHSCCAGGGREARVWAPLVPPAGRNLSGSAGARKPSGQDKAQAAERPCAALEGLPHLVPCRSWGPSAAPASACSPSVPTRLEVPLPRRALILKQNHTSTQRLPAWKAAEAGSRRGGRCGLRGRGGLGPHGRQSTTGRRLPSPWPHLPRVCFPLRRSRRSSSGMRVAPCSVRVAERALLPWVVTRGIAATLWGDVARRPVTDGL